VDKAGGRRPVHATVGGAARGLQHFRKKGAATPPGRTSDGARRGTDVARRLRARWVTPHTFRKTVATLIDKEADTKSAAAQLGHASEDITDTYYIAKPILAPDVSDILEQLGANRGTDDPGDRRPKRAA
jgi:integrase